MTDGNTCAREGCNFHVELIMIRNVPMPSVYCGDACADFMWLKRGLDALEPSPDVAASYQTLNALERLLNGRSAAFEVGPILDGLYA